MLMCKECVNHVGKVRFKHLMVFLVWKESNAQVDNIETNTQISVLIVQIIL